METLSSTLISPHCLTFVARWSTINLDVAQGVFTDQEQLTIESLHGSTEGYLGDEWGGTQQLKGTGLWGLPPIWVSKVLLKSSTIKAQSRGRA